MRKLVKAIKNLDKKEVRKMKKGALVLVAIMILGVISLALPNTGWCYRYTVSDWDTGGNLRMQQTYDASQPTVVLNTTYFANGVRTRMLVGQDEVAWQFNGTLLISSTYDSSTGGDYKTYYDSIGQEWYSVWLDANSNTGDISQTIRIFLGDTESAPAYNSSEIDTPDEENDMAIQNAGGEALKASGLVTVTIGNSNTHSQFNFVSATGKAIKSFSIDTDGDGVRDTTYSFGITTNAWASGNTNPVLFCSGIGKRDTDGKSVNVTVTGTVKGQSKTFTHADIDTSQDPTIYHNDGHWDPAITIGGTLNKDEGTYYITDGDGQRHDLQVLDEGLATQLDANLGKQVLVTGDHADDDPEATMIFLQEFTVQE